MSIERRARLCGIDIRIVLEDGTKPERVVESDHLVGNQAIIEKGGLMIGNAIAARLDGISRGKRILDPQTGTIFRGWSLPPGSLELLRADA